MTRLLNFSFSPVEPDEDDSGRTEQLFRMDLNNQDELEITETDILALAINSLNFLRRIYPGANDMSPVVRLSLTASLASLVCWLDVRPDAATDPRLSDLSVQDSMLTSWARQHTNRDPEKVKETVRMGALELLKARNQMWPLVREVALNALTEINLSGTNPARAAMHGIRADLHHVETNYEGLIDILTGELRTVCESTSQNLAEVLTKWTAGGSFKQDTPGISIAAANMAETIADKVMAQDGHIVRLTTELEQSLQFLTGKFVHDVLADFTEQEALQWLCVIGPHTGSIVHVHTCLRKPLALFPIRQVDHKSESNVG